jgi:hypothetical protein
MTQVRVRRKPGPGGVGDGLPQLPSGEPLLHRWFVIAVAALIPVGVGVGVWAFFAISGATIPPAERRPPGTADVTYDRGDAILNEVLETEAGPSCAEDVTIVGDESARATLRRALSAACQLLRRDAFAEARQGLDRLAAEGGTVRIAVFELTGVESSSRVEDGRVVIELNAKYQRLPGAHAAPAVLHELVHLARGWPGTPVTAESVLAAARTQHAACETLALIPQPPRGCTDASELIALDDPLGALAAAGFPRERGS